MSAEEMPIEFDIPTRRKPPEPAVPDEPQDDLSWLSALFEDDDDSTSEPKAGLDADEADVPRAEPATRDEDGPATAPPEDPADAPAPTATVPAPPPKLMAAERDGDSTGHPPELPHDESETAPGPPATAEAATTNAATDAANDAAAAGATDGAVPGAPESDPVPKAAVRRGFREALLATFSQLHDD